MRGLACLVMFQTHCYDAWVGGDARKSTFLMYSQLGGTLPAPLFLFLAGISFALVVSKLRSKDATATTVMRKMLRRGAEIFALGLLFRFQEYAISWGWAPWSDLFRVDILNMIGLSMMLMALLCGAVISGPKRVETNLVVSSAAVALLIGLVTPLLWTTWQPGWLPWPLESYVNGVHNLGAPQPWLFPIFPWTAFAFAGLAIGFMLFSAWGREHTLLLVAVIGVGGLATIWIAHTLDHLPVRVYAVYDYWHTSPNFLLARIGILLAICLFSYTWCRWGLGAWGFSPLIELGQTSLLVYWVHIEFVYGRLSILPRRAVGIRTASFGLLTIFLMMLVLSLLRTRVDWRRLSLSIRAVVHRPEVAK